ncbi:Glycerate kinase [Lasiodiplodia theobromae]|uniref:Glycerate kinase n=1 Tax=Lasiodiplodia theobromae TaxID=45133 RepID=UPI0015C409BE|nr:Glycerate kinase [Lasiodiplodia theobromae]KAF4534443.1 Glycerate kinase [Lasiodiplodia theobromae]
MQPLLRTNLAPRSNHRRPTPVNQPPSTPLKILIAPSGFKGSLSPHEVADCIETGIRRVIPSSSAAVVRKVPLADGGEGFAQALVAATKGELRPLTVTGPAGEPVRSHYGVLGSSGGGGGGRKDSAAALLPVVDTDAGTVSSSVGTPSTVASPSGNSTTTGKTAVIEMATAAGLSLVPPSARDPTLTTTYGVGQLLAAALDDSAVSRILVGCGDSGTSDGGAGMLQALGVKLLDAAGRELPHASGGAALVRLARIDLSGLHPRLRDGGAGGAGGRVEIEVACNWRNVLCGGAGVARVYGPQKGATAQQVELLSAALDNFASVVERQLGYAVAHTPGGGASGGLGAGLLVLGARLRPRYEAVMEWFAIGDLFADCTLVFTAEGGIDGQTPQGKIPAEVAGRAKKYGIPVIALAGTVGRGADVNYGAGIDAYTSILQRPGSLDEAVAQAEELLVDAAEGAMRTVLVGLAMRV